MALSYSKNIVVDMAFVIQGDGIDELPEHILSVVRIGFADVTKATPVPARLPKEIVAVNTVVNKLESSMYKYLG